MNAGMLDFVWARLTRGRGSNGPNGVGAPEGLTPSAFASPFDEEARTLSPFRLLSLVEKGKKQPAGAQDSFDLETIRSKVREYVEDEDWRIRNVGVKLAGLVEYREILPVLLAMLRDRTPDSLLRRLFGGDFRQVGFVRRNIVKTVGDIGLYSPDVKNALLEALADPYYEVRSCSAATLRRLSGLLGADSGAERALLRRLQDRSFEVVVEAALALGKVGGSETIGPVLSLYTHRNWRVREAVLQTTHDLIERGVLYDASVVERALDALLIPCPSFKPNFPLRGALRDLAQDLVRLKQR